MIAVKLWVETVEVGDPDDFEEQGPQIESDHCR
jgi:hypothetical protein